MKRLVILVAVILVAVSSLVRAQTPSAEPFVRLDPAFSRLVPGNAKLQLLKTGFGFLEGPVWIQQGKTGYLVFADMPANVIYKWTPDGKLSPLVDRCGYTGQDVWRVGMPQTNGKENFFLVGCNGLALDAEGRLLIAGWASRSIKRVEKDGSQTTVADRFEGKRFSGPNDIIVKKNGTIYFTDSVGGMRARGDDPTREIMFNGVYLIKDGKVGLVTKDIENPNGLVLSPDEKTLYINNMGAGANTIMRYDVQADDTVVNGKMFADFSGEKAPGITDGMKVDARGNLYTTCCGGIWVVSPEGKKLGMIRTPELAANLNFGDPDYKSLYITARMGVYKIRLNSAGVPGR